MKIHLKYLSYVVRHKYYVYRAGRFFGVGVWQLLKHDASKFLRSEWVPYANFFYGNDRKYWSPLMRRAWKSHLARNPHHWEYWNGQEIPDRYVREMVADWAGAGKAITGKWSDLISWADENIPKMNLHPKTAEKVDKLIMYYQQFFTKMHLEQNNC